MKKLIRKSAVVTVHLALVVIIGCITVDNLFNGAVAALRAEAKVQANYDKQLSADLTKVADRLASAHQIYDDLKTAATSAKPELKAQLAAVITEVVADDGQILDLLAIKNPSRRSLIEQALEGGEAFLAFLQNSTGVQAVQIADNSKPVAHEARRSLTASATVPAAPVSFNFGKKELEQAAKRLQEGK
jgi:hypothetical protein